MILFNQCLQLILYCMFVKNHQLFKQRNLLNIIIIQTCFILSLHVLFYFSCIYWTISIYNRTSIDNSTNQLHRYYPWILWIFPQVFHLLLQKLIIVHLKVKKFFKYFWVSDFFCGNVSNKNYVTLIDYSSTVFYKWRRNTKSKQLNGNESWFILKTAERLACRKLKDGVNP